MMESHEREAWFAFRGPELGSEPPEATHNYLLTNDTTRRVLMRFVMHEITRPQLIAWASAALRRGDVLLEEDYEWLIEEALRSIVTDGRFDESLAHTFVDRLDAELH